MKEPIPVAIRPILEEIKQRLQEIYGSKLKEVILFGSYARGDAEPGSDIDLIILLEDMEDTLAEREKYFKAILELDRKYDTLISIVPFRESEFAGRRMPLILNAKREGIVL
jgi:predicted nucleotidyltransferase